MSERDEVKRYEFDHPQCGEYDCCGGGGIVEAPEGYGDYVRYEDYNTLRAENAALREQIRVMEKVAGEAHWHWDRGADTKVGKYLAALAGRKGIRVDLDAARAAGGE